jgi:hypothetical protein
MVLMAVDHVRVYTLVAVALLYPACRWYAPRKLRLL